MTAARLTWPGRACLLAAVLAFCAPLYIGLGEWDLRNDEALHSYAVDRIIETGEWMTPRASPSDGPSLEKPPLKFWLVAGGIELGFLPFDDRGMRLLDVTFSAVAFVYVFLFGWRLAGTIAAVVSMFLMFSLDPMLFERLRGNHMEAPLLLGYCGGMYHFVRWADADAIPVRRLHALAFAGFFSLGFMTKFVAILFLPLVCVTAFALAPRAVPRARETWKDWVMPAAFVLATCAPWFVYQTIVNGRGFWNELFVTHVYVRFTGTLVPSHLRPWSYYLTQLWLELGHAQMRLVVFGGLGLLILRAVRKRDWLAQVCLVWFFLPFVLLSIGTSKLFHYLYPFFPPLALGGGVAASAIAGLAGSRYARSLAEWAPTAFGMRWNARGPRARRVLAVVGALAMALGVWTLIFGPVTIEVQGTRIFRNSSALRVFVLGGVAWLVSGYGLRTMKPLTGAAVLLLLPAAAYMPRVERFSSVDHPLRSVRDCALAVQASGASAKTGVFHVSGDVHHAYTYYFRHLGRWVEADAGRPDELSRRLTVPGEQSPVVMSPESYVSLRKSGAAPAAIGIDGNIGIVLPGPYERCVPEVIAGGGDDLR